MDENKTNEKEVEVVNSTNVTEEKKGKSIASLVLGIVSVVGLCVSSSISLICGILGLIFGILGKKTENAVGMAKAGIILSVISLIVVTVVLITLVIILMLGIGTSVLSSI